MNFSLSEVEERLKKACSSSFAMMYLALERNSFSDKVRFFGSEAQAARRMKESEKEANFFIFFCS